MYQPDSDVHITYEDQQKINSFAKFIAKIKDLNEDLKIKENELKTLEEASEEIELFDEDEQIPYLIGEVFISHNLSKTQVRDFLCYSSGHLVRNWFISGTAGHRQASEESRD